VLRSGLGLLSRLGLRLSLLYRLFLGVGLRERGEIDLRGREGDLDTLRETSEYGDLEA